MNYLRKIYGLTLFLSFLCTSLLRADLVIDQGYYARDGEQRPGIRVMIDNTPDDIKKAFEKFMRKNYRLKLKGTGLFTNKDELYAERVMVKKIINKNINFYVKVIEAEAGEERAKMTIFASLGYDVYIGDSNYEEEFDILVGIVNEFVADYVPEMYEDRIKDMEKKVDDLQDDTKDLEKDIKKGEKELEKLEEDIMEIKEELIMKKETLSAEKAMLIKQRAAFANAQSILARIK